MSEETEKKAPAAKARTTAKKTTTAKKPATKKPAGKKTTTRKPAAKTSTAAKKPAAKKAPAKAAAAKASAPGKAAAKASAPEQPKTPEQPKAPEVADTPMGTDAAASEAGQSNDTEHGPSTAEQLKKEFKEKDWASYALRGAFMVLFGFLAWIAISFNFILAGLQFVMLVLTGGPNELIRKVIMVLGNYIVDVMKYLSFETDDRPFPLGKDLPEAE